MPLYVAAVCLHIHSHMYCCMSACFVYFYVDSQQKSVQLLFVGVCECVLALERLNLNGLSGGALVELSYKFYFLFLLLNLWLSSILFYFIIHLFLYSLIASTFAYYVRYALFSLSVCVCFASFPSACSYSACISSASLILFAPAKAITGVFTSAFICFHYRPLLFLLLLVHIYVFTQRALQEIVPTCKSVWLNSGGQ